LKKVTAKPFQLSFFKVAAAAPVPFSNQIGHGFIRPASEKLFARKNIPARDRNDDAEGVLAHTLEIDICNDNARSVSRTWNHPGILRARKRQRRFGK
jgi:hypothetical protein